MPVFVDSNVLVYARDTSEGNKHERARVWMAELWRTRMGRVSLQVLHEFYVTATMKLDPGLPNEEARGDVRDLLAWRPQSLDAPVVEQAWRLEDRFSLSFWDALIVAAASHLGCEHLLTEDLQNGQDLGGVIVVDPFAHEPDYILG